MGQFDARARAGFFKRVINSRPRVPQTHTHVRFPQQPRNQKWDKAPESPKGIDSNKSPLTSSLPIGKRLPQIAKSLRNSLFTVIRAPTGSGKSTEVPRLAAKLLEKTDGRVVVFEPRRLVATGLGYRTAELEECPVGTRVGYRHSLRSESSPEARIEYVTDGWGFRRELVAPSGAHDIVLLDEWHARNIPSDLYLALHRKRHEEGLPVPHVGILSATINARQLGAALKKSRVIECEGRCFPVTQREPGRSVAHDAVDLARQGKNVLVFMYGVPAITDLLTTIRTMVKDEKISVYPLYSQLSHDEQQEALQPQSHPRIILATNCAEVGITIPDIDAVISTGLVRRQSVDDEGVLTLGIVPLSVKELEQEEGRAGRTKPGVAVRHLNVDILPEDAPPEIQNVPLEDWALRLFAAGEDLRTLARYLPDPPSDAQLDDAEATLFRLGLAGRHGHLTDLGEKAAELPLGVRHAKMIVLARDKFASLHLLPHMVDLVAISESEGILSGECKEWRSFCSAGHGSDLIAQVELLHNASRKIWRDVCEQVADEHPVPVSEEVGRALWELITHASLDVLLERPEFSQRAELALFRSVEHKLSEDGKAELLSLWTHIVPTYHQRRDRCLTNIGINVSKLSRAIDVRHMLRRRLELPDTDLKKFDITTAQRLAMQECIWSGLVDRIFQRVGANERGESLYKPITGGSARRLSRDTVIKDAPFVVGSPLNLGVLDEFGFQTYVKLLSNASIVAREWLKTINHEPIVKHLQRALQVTPDHLPGTKGSKRRKAREEFYFRPDTHSGRGSKRRGGGGSRH